MTLQRRCKDVIATLCVCLVFGVILFLCFFIPFSIAITSLGEERANLSAFRTFVRFALVWFCLFPPPLGVWEGLRFVIVALPGLFSYLFSYVEFILQLLALRISFCYLRRAMLCDCGISCGYLHLYFCEHEDSDDNEWQCHQNNQVEMFSNSCLAAERLDLHYIFVHICTLFINKFNCVFRTTLQLQNC